MEKFRAGAPASNPFASGPAPRLRRHPTSSTCSGSPVMGRPRPLPPGAPRAMTCSNYLETHLQIYCVGSLQVRPWRFFSSFLPPKSGDKFPTASWRVMPSSAVDLDILILHMGGMQGSDVPILSVFTTWCQVSTGPRLSPHTTPLESKSVKLPSPSSDDFSKAHLESYIDPPPLY